MINTDSCENNYNRVDTHGFVYRKHIGNICDIVCAFTFKFKDNFESCQKCFWRKKKCIDFTKTNAFKCKVIGIQNV